MSGLIATSPEAMYNHIMRRLDEQEKILLQVAQGMLTLNEKLKPTIYTEKPTKYWVEKVPKQLVDDTGAELKVGARILGGTVVKVDYDCPSGDYLVALQS